MEKDISGSASGFFVHAYTVYTYIHTGNSCQYLALIRLVIRDERGCQILHNFCVAQWARLICLFLALGNSSFLLFNTVLVVGFLSTPLVRWPSHFPDPVTF